MTDDNANPYNPSGIRLRSEEPEQKAFHDTWSQVKDMRKYANVLTKYDKNAEESMRRSQTEVTRVNDIS